MVSVSQRNLVKLLWSEGQWVYNIIFVQRAFNIWKPWSDVGRVIKLILLLNGFWDILFSVERWLMWALLISESDWAWTCECEGQQPGVAQLSLPAFTQPRRQLLRQQHLPEQGRAPPLQEQGHPAIVTLLYSSDSDRLIICRPKEMKNLQSLTGCPSLYQVQHTEWSWRSGSWLWPPSTWLFCAWLGSFGQ